MQANCFVCTPTLTLTDWQTTLTVTLTSININSRSCKKSSWKSSTVSCPLWLFWAWPIGAHFLNHPGLFHSEYLWSWSHNEAGGVGKMQKEVEVDKKVIERNCHKNWRPCRKPAEACFVYLQHSHSAVWNAYIDWKSNNQDSCRLWHPHMRGYGHSAACMNSISSSVVPVGHNA